MTSKAEIQRKIDKEQAKGQAAKNDNAAIQDKLDRLEKAKESISDIQSGFRGMPGSLERYAVTQSWWGSCANDFERKKGEASHSAQSYEDALESVYDAIVNKMRDLTNQQADNDWLQRQVDAAVAALDKWSHDLFD